MLTVDLLNGFLMFTPASSALRRGAQTLQSFNGNDFVTHLTEGFKHMLGSNRLNCLNFSAPTSLLQKFSTLMSKTNQSTKQGRIFPTALSTSMRRVSSKDVKAESDDRSGLEMRIPDECHDTPGTSIHANLRFDNVTRRGHDKPKLSAREGRN